MAGKYVTYWNVSNWESSVVIMLASGRGSGGTYLLQVFEPDGTLIASESKRLNHFQTVKVNLNKLLGNGYTGIGEGLVMVNDTAGGDDEFVCLLIIRGKEQDFKVGNRFIPFTRIE